MHRTLVGGHLQRVVVAHIAGREVAVLKVRLPPSFPPSEAGVIGLKGIPATSGPFSCASGESVSLVLVAGSGLGMLDATRSAIVRDAMRGATSPSQARWRARVEGGWLTEVVEHGLAILREGEAWRVVGTVGKNAIALEPSTKPFGSAAEPTRDALMATGSRLVAELLSSTLGSRRDALRRALSKALGRVERRIGAIRGDLDRIDAAESSAVQARLFVPEAARARRGATNLVAVDWSSGAARTVDMPLDPARTAKEQVDALFRRARRLKDGARIARERFSEAEATRDALRVVAALLREAADDDLTSLERRAKVAAPREFTLASAVPANATTRPERARGVAAPRPPYRLFLGASGPRILVGRGAAHNDALTFHVARPHDLWLHAKNRAGAHVIVPLKKGDSCPANLLVEAAHLAAHFSDARDERLVEVQYAQRRYVRKPRGSAPGRVLVDREKVLVLRRQEELLTRLLEREVLP